MNMSFFERVDLSNVLILRMRPKEELREKLEEVMSKNAFKRAVILSAIGSVYEATFFGVKPNSDLPFGEDKITVLRKTGPFEVLTMEGNILPMGDKLIPHLHVTLGTYDGNVIGGHLDRAIVYTTLELFLAEIKGSDVAKHKDQVAGGIQIKLPIGT
jgi:predicted DNA-binding protein with PD1-like motif